MIRELAPECAAMLLALAHGAAVLRRFMDLSTTAGKLLYLSLSWAVGATVSSIVWFWLRLVIHMPPGYVIAAEIVLLVALIILFRRPRPQSIEAPHRLRDTSHSTRILIAAAVVCGLCCTFAFIFWSISAPNGQWDATAIWNLHARVYFREPHHWRILLRRLVYSHPDYPGLLPVNIARLWWFTGADVRSAPILLSFAFGFAPVLLLASALAALKSWTQAAIAALILFGTSSYAYFTSWQYADLATGFYMLASFVCLSIRPKESDRPMLILAGFFAAAASWTKNEGELFTLALAAVAILAFRRRAQRRLFLRRCGRFATGFALPFVTALVYKKLVKAQSDVMFWMLDPHRWALGFTGPRIWQIVKSYALEAWNLDAWAISPVLWFVIFMDISGIQPKSWFRRNSLRGLLVLIIMLVGYIAVYATSAQDLTWYLSSSLDRLFLQLWPSIVFLLLLLTRSPVLQLGGRTEAVPLQTYEDALAVERQH